MILSRPPHVFFAGASVYPDAINRNIIAAHTQLLPAYARQMARQFAVHTASGPGFIATIPHRAGIVMQVERVHLAIVHAAPLVVTYGPSTQQAVVSYPAQSTLARWQYTIQLNQLITAAGAWNLYVDGDDVISVVATVHYATRRLQTNGQVMPDALTTYPPSLLRDGDTSIATTVANNAVSIDSICDTIRLSQHPPSIHHRYFAEFDADTPEGARYSFIGGTTQQTVVRIYGHTLVPETAIPFPVYSMIVRWGTGTPTILNLTPAVSSAGEVYHFDFALSLPAPNPRASADFFIHLESGCPVTYASVFIDTRRSS
jgi:hypothetical protein